ncbi:Imidazolonepropionase [Serratia rubidaea]|uniref:Imidazolonepropionase n=1 Tax=Serratia rubidaea TaxID=61652 RepID=A0A4V6JGX8_SERRU|nr:Imidazolonepropionase [Serratia rubidaea]
MTSEIHCDSLWHGADIVTMREGKYHILHDGALAVRDGKIVWIGEYAARPAITADETVKFEGGIITPGLVDCHTHLVFGGDRSAEFEQRLNGVSYAEIAAQGGGIISTVNATRNAPEEQLLAQAQFRLRPLLAEGVTCVEVKSGYGLTPQSELKMLRVARRLAETLPVEVKTTCLAAHALPPEYAAAPMTISIWCATPLFPKPPAPAWPTRSTPSANIWPFRRSRWKKVFAAAERAGLPVKLHAEQLSALGGSALAARHRALSADHLEYATEQDAQAMGAAGTVAVLLPGAYYLLRETQCPPVELFRKHRVPMAIASDANPGTSPALSLRLMMNMACTLFRLTPEEALAGVTLHAARALGLQESHGSLESGKVADFVHWPLSRPAELTYWLGGQLPCTVIFRGEVR